MKKIVVLTGAGMSVESGLTTFRDAGGLWDNYPVEHYNFYFYNELLYVCNFPNDSYIHYIL